ncbi:MAG: hypothetical protein ACTSVI_13420 [Promethearchaeota archaeon]
MGKKKSRTSNEEEKNGSERIEKEEPKKMDYSYLSNIEISIDKDKYFEINVSSAEEIEKIQEKLQSEVDNLKSLMKKLEQYFNERVEQLNINNKEFEITIPLEYASMKFVTILSLTPLWIFIKCKVLSLDDINEKTRYKLYEAILTSNFELNAVFYSVDPEISGVWIENDIPTTNLNMDNFDISFKAIIFGIRYFIDNIATSLNQEVKSTFNNSYLYT